MKIYVKEKSQIVQIQRFFVVLFVKSNKKEVQAW